MKVVDTRSLSEQFRAPAGHTVVAYARSARYRREVVEAMRLIRKLYAARVISDFCTSEVLSPMSPYTIFVSVPEADYEVANAHWQEHRAKVLRAPIP